MFRLLIGGKLTIERCLVAISRRRLAAVSPLSRRCLEEANRACFLRDGFDTIQARRLRSYLLIHMHSYNYAYSSAILTFGCPGQHTDSNYEYMASFGPVLLYQYMVVGLLEIRQYR